MPAPPLMSGPPPAGKALNRKTNTAQEWQRPHPSTTRPKRSTASVSEKRSTRPRLHCSERKLFLARTLNIWLFSNRRFLTCSGWYRSGAPQVGGPVLVWEGWYMENAEGLEGNAAAVHPVSLTANILPEEGTILQSVHTLPHDSRCNVFRVWTLFVRVGAVTPTHTSHLSWGTHDLGNTRRLWTRFVRLQGAPALSKLRARSCCLETERCLAPRIVRSDRKKP